MKVRSDTREWQRIKKRLLAKKYQANIGWFAGDRYGDTNSNLPMAQVAQWVEEGHRGGWGPAPPRPAIRVHFMPDLIKDIVFNKMIMSVTKSVADGTLTWRNATIRLAEYSEKSLKKTLINYNVIGNAQATIDIKGFNDPWRNTGQLITSVNYKITIQNIKG